MSTPRRYSKQRQLVLDAIKMNPCHPTADVVYKIVAEEHPEISLGTVYRNLNLLVEIGEIVRVDSGCTKEHFDGDTDFHPHFICKDCGEIYDISMPEAKCIEDTIKGKLEHQIDGCKLIIHGTCKNCLKLN